MVVKLELTDICGLISCVMEIKDAKITDLVHGNVYRLKNKKTGKTETAVFHHVGKTGMAIFSSPGEPSFQDYFALNNFEDWEFTWLRYSNREDNPFLYE